MRILIIGAVAAGTSAAAKARRNNDKAEIVYTKGITIFLTQAVVSHIL